MVYVGESKAPESCWFPRRVYCLYWKHLTCEYIPEKEQRPSVTACWDLELCSGQRCLVKIVSGNLF